MPNLTIEGILAWVDAHHAASGKWPRKGSGQVAGVTHKVTWKAINEALQLGRARLDGGDDAGPPAGRTAGRSGSPDRRANPHLGRRLPRGPGPLALPPAKARRGDAGESLAQGSTRR